jgi:hypothetical protein
MAGAEIVERDADPDAMELLEKLNALSPDTAWRRSR